MYNCYKAKILLILIDIFLIFIICVVTGPHFSIKSLLFIKAMKILKVTLKELLVIITLNQDLSLEKVKRLMNRSRTDVLKFTSCLWMELE